MKAGLLLALMLVLAPVSAFAECAWVLWINDNVFTPSPQAPSLGLILSDAYPSYQQCQAQGRAFIESMKTTPAVRGGEHVFTFRCLPDTVDLRGPKESKP